MTFQDYFSTTTESTTASMSYEEQLLLNYEDYLESNFAAPLKANENNYILELRDEFLVS